VVRLEVRNIVVISLGSLMVLSLFTMFTEQALAEETTVVHENSDVCDTLVVPALVDELGNKPAFPDDEWISSSVIDLDTDEVACPSNITPPDKNPNPNVIVSITNNSPFAFSDLWYVADDFTSITNFDVGVGTTFHRAFKIDSVISDPAGKNHPLISESFSPANDIFESGEIWSFVLDGYIQTEPNNMNTLPSDFGTKGVPSPVVVPPAKGTGLDGSTGNIIAIHKGVFVGGTLLPLDTTALMLYYIQGTAVWMIPIILAAVSIGIVLARKF